MTEHGNGPESGLEIDPSLLDADAVIRALHTDSEHGLSSAEAAARLARYGKNELVGALPVPVWRKLLAQFEDPLIYLLLAAVAISAVAWFMEGAHGWPVDSAVILAIVVANGVLGYVQEAKAENAVAALASMAAATSAVVRNGQVERILSSEIVPGDVLVLSEGDNIGADGRLFKTANLRVAEAPLTGESEPVQKETPALQEPSNLGDRRNMVFKGTAVTQGVGRAVVTATGMNTEVGKIARMLETTEDEATPLQKEIVRLGKMLGIAVVLIAAVVVTTTFVVFRVDTMDEAVSLLLLGVSLAVAAVPEGLPAVLSVVLAIGVQRMAARNAIVKKLSSAETLGSASVICSDKTGTLTKSEMTVTKIVTASGEVELTGVGYDPSGRAEVAGQEIGDSALRTEAQCVLAGGSLAGNASLRQRDGVWEIQGDPTEAAFLVAAQKLGGTQQIMERYERLGEIPFTSERKRMSVLLRERNTGRLTLFSKGAPDVLLERCTHILVGNEVAPLDNARRAASVENIEALSAQAFRTIAVAYRNLEGDKVVPAEEGAPVDESLEADLVYVGIVGILDPPRPEAAKAVVESHRAGVRVIMITGDHPKTATRIASDLGIVGKDATALTGMEIDKLGEAALREAVRTTSVYARVAPEHKLQIVDALQAGGNVVAMTGDGVNDAPALKRAEIGVAMGVTGTDVTKEAGNMVLADDNFATIVAAVHEGRVIFDNIRKFLRYLLSSNMGEVLAVFFGVVLSTVIGLTSGDGGIVLPLLATQLLWINLVTDAAPAMALGVDPETEDVMARPPRKLTDRVIDGRMWTTVLIGGSVMAAMTLLTLDILLPGGLFEGTGSLDTARTAAFTVLVFTQLFNVFNSRSEHASAFHRLCANRWLLGAVLLGVVLQVAVVHIPFMNAAFGTTPLTGEQWILCVLMASAVLWVEEARKLVWRTTNLKGKK